MSVRGGFAGHHAPSLCLQAGARLTSLSHRCLVCYLPVINQSAPLKMAVMRPVSPSF